MRQIHLYGNHRTTGSCIDSHSLLENSALFRDRWLACSAGSFRDTLADIHARCLVGSAQFRPGSSMGNCGPASQRAHINPPYFQDRRILSRSAGSGRLGRSQFQGLAQHYFRRSYSCYLFYCMVSTCLEEASLVPKFCCPQLSEADHQHLPDHNSQFVLCTLT
jgi:hypothetical protein